MVERIIEIILYVISELKLNKNFSEINVKELEKLGYTSSEISTAFSWIADKIETADKINERKNEARKKSFRILHDAELELFTTEAHGELIQYQSLGLLSSENLETIIERTIMAGIPVIDSRLLKNFVAAMVFDNHNHHGKPGRVTLIGNDTIN